MWENQMDIFAKVWVLLLPKYRPVSLHMLLLLGLMKGVLGQTDPPISAATHLSHPRIWAWVDSSKTATQQNAAAAFSAGKFVPLDSLPWAGKYERGKYAYWHQFRLHNASASTEQIAFSIGAFEQVSVFEADHQIALMGARVPVEGNPNRAYPRRFSTQLEVPPRHELTYWVRFAHQVEINRPPEPRFYESAPQLADELDLLVWFYISLMGFFLVLFFFGMVSLFQFVQHRDRAYGYYGLYLLLMMTFYSRDFDMNSPLFHLWPLEFQDQRYLTALVACIAICYMQFLGHFLNARKKLPRLARSIRLWSWASVLFVPVEGILRMIDPWLAWAAYSYFKIFALILCVGLIIFLLRNRTPLNGYILLGTMALTFSSLVTALMSFLPSHLYFWWDITYFPQYAGILIEIMCFSLGLATKSRWAEQEKSQAQASLVIKEIETQQLIETEQRRRRFFTHLSHDFRTPLTVMLGLAKQLRSTSTPQQQPQVDQIQQSSQHVLQLVDQLLDVASLEAGKLTPRPIPVELRSWVESVMLRYQSLAQHDGIDLRWTPPPQAAWANVDPQLLEHILGNFLSNALKFAPTGSEVSVHLLLDEQDRWLLSVEDQGPGIPTENRVAIFERFFKDSRRPGYGLGLAFVKELANLMNVALYLSSEPGHGSTFGVRLPACAPPSDSFTAEVLPHQVLLPSDLQGARVLLV
ncbi:MAG: sensor histidine kinase, partial [Bacteroidota bacterium]